MNKEPQREGEHEGSPLRGRNGQPVAAYQCQRFAGREQRVGGIFRPVRGKLKLGVCDGKIVTLAGVVDSIRCRRILGKSRCPQRYGGENCKYRNLHTASRALKVSTYMLDPIITSAFCGCFDADLVAQDIEEIQALAPFVASDLCNSGGSLVSIQQDIDKLAMQDPQALREINRACRWDWDEDAAYLAALNVILAECRKALDFRIDWDKRHTVGG